MDPNDVEAVSALYRSYAPELLGAFHRRFPWSHDIVEDAVQHAFLQLQTVARPPGEPRAWLRTVTHHYIIDRLRADGKLVRDDELIDGLAADTGSSASRADGISTTLVQRALQLLTTRARRILRGKYQEGKTYGTLAREEGVAKSGMGRILDRARQRLRRAVEELQQRKGRE
ncbi:MAG TPA: sigma-70 family RNA polymerase sigma factor [Gemmatimonadales bacterium]|jgi:RNA polymerase sigma factor (sigma-70 family)